MNKNMISKKPESKQDSKKADLTLKTRVVRGAAPNAAAMVCPCSCHTA